MNFQQHSERWLIGLTTGSNPVRPKTLATYRSILRSHLLPRYQDQALEVIASQNNRILRDLVTDLRGKYAPSSIHLIIGTMKQILESPRNENGLPIYSLTWALDFIDMPAVDPARQKAPVVTAAEVEAACADVKDGPLYLLLAASGLRISEALGLVREDIEKDGSAVRVRQSKTPNGVRTVDLHPAVAKVVAKLACDAKPGARVLPRHLTTIRNRIRVPGFHSLRRFRESVLQRSEARSLLVDFWMGHANRDMSTRYAKQLLADVAFRKDWAQKVGLGFTLPEHLYYGPVLQTVENVNLEMP